YGAIRPGFSSIFKVRNSTSGLSLYFSINFCRRGNSSQQYPHQDAQKFKNVTLPLRDATLQVFPFRSASSNGARGSFASSQRSVTDCSSSFARRPYHIVQPSLVPPRLDHSFFAFSASSSFSAGAGFCFASSRASSAFS